MKFTKFKGSHISPLTATCFWCWALSYCGEDPYSRFCVHDRCPAEPLGVTLYSVPTGVEDTRLPFRAGTVGLTLGFLVMLCSLSCYSLTGRSQLLRSPMGSPWQTLAKGRHTLLVYSVVFHAATLLQARRQTW